jgi:hypothetical protein
MAFTKIITPGSQDFSEPVAQLIKYSSSGLHGCDLDQFVKRASVRFMDKLAGISFGPGEIPVHLIALGSTEAYGNNRNGDGFKEAVCKQYHPTFVKLARFYRDHANKDLKKSYGIVKASDYNDKMRRVELLIALNGTKEAADRNGGLVADEELEKLAKDEDLPVSMACVLDPTYPVLTRDRGYVGVADITVGDYVWTKAGRWRRVYALNRRKYTGETLTFRVNGQPIALELTADHPMWAKVFAGSRETPAIKAKTRRYFKDTTAFNNETATWTNASEIGIGDRFFYRPVTRYTGYGRIADISLATIMGYYLAEGSFGYNGDHACTTQFSCNMADSLPRRLPALVESMYPDITVDIHPHHNSNAALNVEIHSTQFSEFLRKYVGRGCKHKVIPPEIFNADREIKLAFIGAWLDGDGWIDKKGGHISTTSNNLALQGRDLLVSIGIPASIYMIDHAKCATSGKPGSGIEYTINIAHLDLWNLSGASEKVAAYPTVVQQRTKPSAMRLCPDGSYAYRISKIESRYVSDAQTYNFEVEDDESYSLGGFVSHNCRVSEDVCSGCGNHAKTRKDYCGPEQCTKYGGLRDNMAKTFEDGHTLHADNPDPAFFDISKVFRPADRIAYTLGRAKCANDYETMLKAASVATGEAQGGAAIAEYLGVTPPLWMLTEGPWSDPRIVGQLKLAQELIRLEEELADSTPSPLDQAFDTCVQPTYETALDDNYKLAHVIAALAGEQCMLPLSTFIAIVAGKTPEQAEKLAKEVAPRLAGVYNRLASDPRLEEDLRQNPYLPQGSAPRRLRHWVLKHANAWGFTRPKVVERLQLAVLRNPQARTQRQQLTKVAMATKTDELAKEYALYQLGLLQHLADQPDSDLRNELVVRSNYMQ